MKLRPAAARPAQVFARRSVRLPASQGLVSFTFEGFPASAAVLAAPVLEGGGVRGTFYTAPALWGQQWREQTMATSTQVEDLHRNGHEIGCYTHHAVAVNGLDKRQLAREVQESALAFKAGGADRRFTSFAYPDGAVSLVAKRMLSRTYSSCRGTLAGVNVGTADLGLLRSEELADRILNPLEVTSLLDRIQAQHGWLIFRSAAVTERPQSGAGCSAALLAHAVSEAERRGLEVLPVRHAVGRLTAA